VKTRGLFLLSASLFLASALPAAVPAEGAMAPVEIFDSMLPQHGTVETLPELRPVAPDGKEYVFKGSPVLRNGRITIAVVESAIHLFSVAEDGKETLRSRIKLVGTREAVAGRLVSVQISKDEHGQLINGPACASLSVTFDGPGKPLEARILLTRGSAVCKITPAANVESIRIISEPSYLLMPAFLGDDLLFVPSDHSPGRAFLPSENMLLELVGDGNAIVQTVWPVAGEQEIECEVTNTAGQRRVGFLQLALDGREVYVACWERSDLWHIEPLDSRSKGAKDEAAGASIEWHPPFPAVWRAVYHGERSTSWNVRSGKATGLLGPHGADKHYAWPFRIVDGNVELHHPPLEIQQGRARVALLYPLQRTGGTPRSVPTPADILREALGSGPCEYLLAREQRQRNAPGGPLCVLGARFAILSLSYARNHRASQFMTRLVDWCADEGTWQFERASDYLNFAKMVRKKLDSLLKSAPQLRDEYNKIATWDDELLKQATQVLDVMPSVKERWTDFVPQSNDAIEAMKELAAQLKAAIRGPRNPETLAQWQDLMGKLHTVAVHPQVMLPRVRRLTRMIQNEATRLATISPETSEFASSVRLEARRTLRGAHWAEQER